MTIQVGAPFPPFQLPAIDSQNEIKTLSPEDLRGQKWLLFVYPKDQTCGCTLEACGFRDLQTEFAAQGVQILGLSRDSVRSHANFIAKQELNYSLLSDEGGVWLKANGLIFDAKMYGKPVTKVARTTVLVDENGVVQQLWEKVSPPGHAQSVLDFVMGTQ